MFFEPAFAACTSERDRLGYVRFEKVETPRRHAITLHLASLNGSNWKECIEQGSSKPSYVGGALYYYYITCGDVDRKRGVIKNSYTLYTSGAPLSVDDSWDKFRIKDKGNLLVLLDTVQSWDEKECEPKDNHVFFSKKTRVLMVANKYTGDEYRLRLTFIDAYQGYMPSF